MARWNRFSSYGDDYGFWPRTPTVAERKAAAAREVGKLAKKGEALAPVQTEGRRLANTFWGKAWCTNLDSYADYENRLPRGRSYLHSGQVIDLRVERGKVTARVMGTRLYRVSVAIDPIDKKAWKSIVRACSGQIGSMIELLQGRLSDAVMSTVTQPRTGLFPTPQQIHFECSCPDWASMCKHVAASLYGIGTRLDTAPELLFLLRGVDASELVVNAAAAEAITSQAEHKALRADSAELEGLFGIEMSEGPKPAAAIPKKLASRAGKPRARRPAAVPSAKPAVPPKPGPGRIVTQAELDARGIEPTVVEYWVNEKLLVATRPKGTYVATAEGVRRIERCPMRARSKRAAASRSSGKKRRASA